MAADEASLDDLDLDDIEAQCHVATNAVLEVALKHCSDDELKRVLAQMVGLTADVDQALREAPETLEGSDCLEIRRVRAWVVNEAAALVNGQGEDVADAVTKAWAEANETCGWD